MFYSTEIETRRNREVLLKVEATSVNPVDTKIRSGVLQAISPPFPAILQGDVSGIVESVGAGD